MKIIQANSISVNGMIARQNGDEDWLPDDGWTEFVEAVKAFDNFIIGRETYEVVQQHDPQYSFDKVPCKTKIIVSRNPSYIAPKGYITARSPQEVLSVLGKQGHEVGHLVGGGKLNASFYAEGFVDEMWLTVCPTAISGGRGVIDGENIQVDLSLSSVQQLSKDRVLLKYSVRK